MKVKRRREDFVVREISNFAIQGGAVAIYQLEKSGIGTPEAIQIIQRTWNLSQKDVSYGGLKDRHAITTQTISIYGGPHADLDEEKFSLRYLGQASVAFQSKDIVANEFEIRLRGLTKEHADKMLACAQDPSFAVPNYFDQQRFGSVGASGEFVAHPWCLGNYEKALYLAIAEFNPNDSPPEREQKEIVRDHWGDWQACKDRLERSNRRSVITYLVDHPTGYKKAAALISRDMRSLYVSAFQSRLWNDVVSRWIKELLAQSNSANTNTVELQSPGGTLTFPIGWPPEVLERLRNADVALPSGRKSSWDPQVRKLLEGVLGEYEMQLHQLRFSHPRDVFFARGLRSVLVAHSDLEALVEADDLGEPGQKALRLQFRIAAGQYATMLIKGLELCAEAP